MRARTNPLFALISILAGGAFAVMASTAGCGSKTDEGDITPTTDSGLSFAETTPDTRPADTGTVVEDASKQYDVPGSLFDAPIPDVAFEGGKTLGGCYSCTTDECKAEVAACDTDPRCRGLVLCAMIKCAGSFTDFGCILGCAGEYDVTSTSDPIVSKAYAVGNCVQSKCPDDCPLPADAGMMADAKADTMADAKADAMADAMADTMADTRTDSPSDSAAEASAFMIYPSGDGKQSKQIDPELARTLQNLFMTLGALPHDARASLIDTMSAPH